MPRTFRHPHKQTSLTHMHGTRPQKALPEGEIPSQAQPARQCLFSKMKGRRGVFNARNPAELQWFPHARDGCSGRAGSIDSRS